MTRPIPTGVENTFPRDQILVSKTDLRGVITYANPVFCKVCRYPEAELLGRPHSIIRHPDMPRSVFHLMWEEIKQRREVLAYVINLAKDGGYYWVFAHVTPDINPETHEITGYHSSRRYAAPGARRAIAELYRVLCEEEAQHRSPRDATAAGRALLAKILADAGKSYHEFVFDLYQQGPARRSAA